MLRSDLKNARINYITSKKHSVIYIFLLLLFTFKHDHSVTPKERKNHIRFMTRDLEQKPYLSEITFESHSEHSRNPVMPNINFQICSIYS